MKFIFVTLALAASAMAAATGDKGDKGDKDSKSVCDVDQTVVCKDNGNGSLISLGNIANGALGDSCSGDVYCCNKSGNDETGVLNLDVSVDCSFAHLL